MASRKRAFEAVNAVARGVEKGELLSFLRKVPDEELDTWPIEGQDDETIYGFVRAEARGSLPAAAGDSAMEALAVKVTKAVVKGLKPVLKPVLLNAYGPRSSSSAQSEYRPAALLHYTGELKPPYVTCAVSGVQLPLKDVVAGHIYQQRWPPTDDVKINDPSNILLMHHKVEQHFDNFAFTVTPVDLKVLLLHKKQKDKVLFDYKDDGGHKKSVKLGDLDGRQLAIAEDKAPSEYALRVHAASAINHALRHQWCSAAVIRPTVSCDRELFQGFLRDSASGSGSGGGSGGRSGGGSSGRSGGRSGGGSGGSSGGGSDSIQDINITSEADATGYG